jgi:hypothetical protein
VLPTEPLFIASADGAIVGAKPIVPEPIQVEPEPTPAEDSDSAFNLFADG